MTKFQVKHRSRARYGLIDTEGQWLVDFLGTKEEAIAKADSLNANNKQPTSATVEKTNNKNSSNSTNRKQFVLTKKGWLLQGEK